MAKDIPSDLMLIIHPSLNRDELQYILLDIGSHASIEEGNF